MRQYLSLIIISIILLSVVKAQVSVSFQKIGDKYGVDAGMLYAISMTETARKSNYGMTTPWPWTANICDMKPGVRCKGYWFESREELYERLTQELKRGNEWFDVGIMQINWHYHSHRFGKDLWLASHPLVNINQAVGLLLEIQKKHQSPFEIYAAYHAGLGWKNAKLTEKRREQIKAYATKTVNNYNKIMANRGN